MIIQTNVCDQCGNATQVAGEKFCGLHMEIKVVPVAGKTDWKMYIKTFCDKDCLIEYLRSHTTNEGFKETAERKDT